MSEPVNLDTVRTLVKSGIAGLWPHATVLALLEALDAARTALEWYADDRNYSEDTGAAGTFHRIPSTPDQAPGEFHFEPDCGDVARAALAPAAGEGSTA